MLEKPETRHGDTSMKDIKLSENSEDENMTSLSPDETQTQCLEGNEDHSRAITQCEDYD